jgi:hypothetical protein
MKARLAAVFTVSILAASVHAQTAPDSDLQAAQAKLAARTAAKKAAATQPTKLTNEEVDKLRAENTRLIAEVRDLKQQLAAATAQAGKVTQPVKGGAGKGAAPAAPAVDVPEPKIGDTEKEITAWIESTHQKTGLSMDRYMTASVTSETAKGKIITVATPGAGPGGFDVRVDVLSYKLEDGKIVRIDRFRPVP